MGRRSVRLLETSAPSRRRASSPAATSAPGSHRETSIQRPEAVSDPVSHRAGRGISLEMRLNQHPNAAALRQRGNPIGLVADQVLAHVARQYPAAPSGSEQVFSGPANSWSCIVHALEDRRLVGAGIPASNPGLADKHRQGPDGRRSRPPAQTKRGRGRPALTRRNRPVSGLLSRTAISASQREKFTFSVDARKSSESPG